MSYTFTSDIVNLNVGGTRFSTSRQTLSSTQDSFFTSMLSGRIPTCRDETGALFIDRDPKLFSIILHFLRTKELDLNGVDVSVLRHEAEFYGKFISPYDIFKFQNCYFIKNLESFRKYCLLKFSINTFPFIILKN